MPRITAPFFALLVGCAQRAEAPLAKIALLTEGTIRAGDVVALDGSGSTDSSEMGLPLTYHWALAGLPAGSRAELNATDLQIVSFVPDLYGDYTVSLVVSNGLLNSAAVTQLVSVATCGNEAPVVDTVTADPATPSTGDVVQLAATFSDADNDADCGFSQEHQWAWSISGLPAGSSARLNDAAAENPSFRADTPGDYVLELVVTDDTGRRSTPGTLTVTVSDCGDAAPSIDEVAVTPEEPNTGDAVTLAITASDADNDTCGLGQTLSLASTFVGRPAGSGAALAPGEGPTPSFVADVPGTYVVRTIVSDGTGRASFADTTVDVDGCGDARPVVDAAVVSDPAPDVGDLVSFALTVSDADNGCGLDQTLTTRTAFLDLPEGSAAELVPANGLTPAFVADVPGTYTLRATVTDGTGRSGTLDFSVTVSSCGSNAPEVDDVGVSPASPATGDLVTLTVAVSDLDLVGFAVADTAFVDTSADTDGGDTDTDGGDTAINVVTDCALGQSLSVVSILVELPAGSSAGMAPSMGLTPAFVADVPGTYVVRTTVSDGTGRSGSVDTEIAVSACGDAAPVIDDVAIDPNPANTGDLVSFLVSVSDSDIDACGLDQELTVASWFVDMPSASAAELVPSVGMQPAFVADVPGDYVVRTRVTDATGRSAHLDSFVTVTECGNAPPSIDLVTVTPGAPNVGDMVRLAVDTSDEDNAGDTGDTGGGCGAGQALVVTSTFVQVPGGSAAVLLSSSGSSPAFVADKAGTYTIRTTVDDGTGRTSFVDTDVVVDDCGSNDPVVDAVDFAPDAPNTDDLVEIAVTVSDADVDDCGLDQTLDVTTLLVSLPPGSAATMTPSEGLTPAFAADVPGDYIVRTFVDDGTGRASFVDTTIAVDPCGGNAPEVADVDVTPTPTVVTGDTVTLTISVGDEDVDTCGLTQDLFLDSVFVQRPAGSSAALSPAEGPTPTFTADLPGTYVVRTTVSDTTGRESTVDTSVTVDACGDNDPVFDDVDVSAGPRVGAAVTLTIAVSDEDVDSCTLDQDLTVTTSFVDLPGGSAATLAPSAGLTPSFVPDVSGVYTLRSVVDDGTGRSSVTLTSVTVDDCGENQPSIDDIDVSATPIVGQTVTLTIASSDADNDDCALGQDLFVTTSFVDVPAGSAATLAPSAGATPAFVPDVSGAYTLRTTVDDGTGRSTSTDTTVTVDDCGEADPVLALFSQVPASPNTGDSVVLTLEADDADNDADTCDLGQTLTVTSSLVSSPAASAAVLAPANGLTPTFVADVDGVYVVRSVLTDGTGRSDVLETSVTVDACGNAAPVVDDVDTSPATPDTYEEVAVTVSASDTDIDDCGLGQTLTASSSFVDVPVGSSAVLTSAVGFTPSFVPDQPGAYTIRTVVDDGTGRTTTVDTTVDVDVCGSRAPTIDAITVTPTPVTNSEPDTTDFVQLDIDVDDEDLGCGTSQTLSIHTEFVEQPAGSEAVLAPSDGPNVGFQADEDGTYVLRTTVTDSTGLSDTTETTIAVDDCGTAAPTALLQMIEPSTSGTSNNLTVTVTKNDTVQLTAAASSDADAACGVTQTLSYFWEFTEMPEDSNAFLNSSTIVNPSFDADEENGDFRLRLTVSDGRDSSTATVRVQVNP